MQFNTCRLCKKSDEPLFKYAVRHYAHAECGFKKWNAGFLDMIPQHEIQRMPYRAIEAAGLMDEVNRRMKAAS